jgi:hypothetical protein
MTLPDYAALVVVQRQATQRFDEAMSLGEFKKARAWAYVSHGCAVRMVLVSDDARKKRNSRGSAFADLIDELEQKNADQERWLR